MWPFKKHYNELGETPEQELRRRLEAAEGSLLQLKEDYNRLDGKWLLHESDITTLRKAWLGIPQDEVIEPPPDTEGLFPDPYQPGSRDNG